VDVITAVTSDGSATVAIHLANANDLLTATALTGLTEGKQLPMAAVKTTPIKLAAEKAVTVTVGTAALTAGKFDGYIVWMEGA
jgi:predicted aconitase with swiveling domain